MFILYFQIFVVNNIKVITQDYVRLYLIEITVKPVLCGHSKTDKMKVLKTGGSLMLVQSIAECSRGAFCNTFDMH